MDNKVHIDVEGEDDFMSDDGSIHSPQALEALTASGPAPTDTKPSIQERMRQLGAQGAQQNLSKPEGLSVAVRLPEKIWAEILGLLHPQELGMMRCVSRLFNGYINNETIWKKSRKVYFPDMPRPVFGLKEWEMFRLGKGQGCMVCHDRRAPPGSFLQTVWQFRVRCCKACLNEKTTREEDLSLANYPKELYTALAFAFIDSNGMVYNIRPNAPVSTTKIYWSEDIVSIKERYDEAKEMNAEEEWLKGLDLESESNRLDLTRIAKWKSRKSYAANGRKGAGPTTDDNIHHSRGNAPIPNAPPHHLLQPNHGFIDSKQQGFSQPQYGGNARVERSAGEVAEIRNKRMQEIQRRCAELTPPISPELLGHMAAYQAAMLIAQPLTDRAWEVLVPKLQEQRHDAEEKERRRQEGLAVWQRQAEERRAQDLVLKEVKEKTDREWEEVQAPVREELLKIADGVISGWSDRINKETSPAFAADVLIRTRMLYYQKHPYSTEDPEHRTPMDPAAPGGAAALEKPMTNRLVLENMKYVFDMKIKPLTDQHTKELFLCNGCHHNPKFYGFEGVIQHYAAKHTTKMTLGSTIVHWKASWPYHTPFHPSPASARQSMPVGMYNSGPNAHARHNQRQFPPVPPGGGNQHQHHQHQQHQHQHHHHHQQHVAMRPGPVPHGTPSPFAAPYGSPFPPPPQPPHMHYQQQIAPIPTPPLPHMQPYYEEVVQFARESWFQLSGIKDLPASVRVHYVIQKTATFSRMKYNMELDFNIFVHALKDHPSMKPLRNVNGLICLSCTTIPGGIPGQGRVFTLTALLAHFDNIHVRSNQLGSRFDWKIHMIKLPDVNSIGMMRNAPGMDHEKLRMLSEVFPMAFAATAPPAPQYNPYQTPPPSTLMQGLYPPPTVAPPQPPQYNNSMPPYNPPAPIVAPTVVPVVPPPAPPPLPPPPPPTQRQVPDVKIEAPPPSTSREAQRPEPHVLPPALPAPPPPPGHPVSASLQPPLPSRFPKPSGSDAASSNHGTNPHPPYSSTTPMTASPEPPKVKSEEKAEQFLTELTAGMPNPNLPPKPKPVEVEEPREVKEERRDHIPPHIRSGAPPRPLNKSPSDYPSLDTSRSLYEGGERHLRISPPPITSRSVPDRERPSPPTRSPESGAYRERRSSADREREAHRAAYAPPIPPPPSAFDRDYPPPPRGRSRSPPGYRAGPPPPLRYAEEDLHRRRDSRGLRDPREAAYREHATWPHPHTPYVASPRQYTYPPPAYPPPYDRYEEYAAAEYRAAQDRARGYPHALPPHALPPQMGYYDRPHHYPPYYDDRRAEIPPPLPRQSTPPPPPPGSLPSRLPPSSRPKQTHPRPEYPDQEPDRKRMRSNPEDYYPPPPRDRPYR